MTVLEQTLIDDHAYTDEERALLPADCEGGWTTATDPDGW